MLSSFLFLNGICYSQQAIVMHWLRCLWMYVCIDEIVNIRLIGTNLFWHNWCLSCLVLLIYSVSTEIDDVNHNVSQYKKSGASSHKICLKPSFMTMSGIISDQSFTYRYIAIFHSWQYNVDKLLYCMQYTWTFVLSNNSCHLQYLPRPIIISFVCNHIMQDAANNWDLFWFLELLHQLHQLQY